MTKTGLILLIFILAFAVRFYNFPNRITFWSEQARSLIVSGNYLEKPSLLGQEYFRVTSYGHKLFSGAIFNYMLVPLLLFFQFNPIPITGVFGLLNIVTGFVVYKIADKFYGPKVAVLAVVLFLFNDLMIYHSLFIWNYNLLPLVGLFIYYLTLLNLKKESEKYMFLIGVLCGFGVNIQLLFLPLVPLVLIINLLRSKKRLKMVMISLLGLALGNFSMVLFDLRHNFYHAKALLQYFVDTLHGVSDASFAYYYLLPFAGVLAVFFSLFLYRGLFGKLKILYVFMLVYVIVNLTSPKISFTKPLGMPPNLNIVELQNLASSISQDAEGEFNVASVLDFDKKAYVLRYYLQFVYDEEILSEEQYQTVQTLYVLANEGFDFAGSDIWEIRANWPYEVNLLASTSQNYAMHKLEK